MTDQNDSFLRDEYLKLQDQYEDYDRRALLIKGWIGAGSIAGFALGTNGDKHITFLTLFSIALIACCFWYLEAKWKTFQYAIANRIRVIEAHFRKDPDILYKDPAPFQIYNWWFKSYLKNNPIYKYERYYKPVNRHVHLKKAAFQDFVHLPYSLIILLCVLMGVIDLFSSKPTAPTPLPCQPVVVIAQPLAPNGR